MKTNIQTSTYSQWKHLLVVLLLGLMSTSVTGASYYNKYYDDAVSSGSNTDDDFIDLSSIDLDQVSLMPVSCVNYNNGNMIKFQLFSSSNNFQCHNNNLGTFVVSISHYMRAYFNYQALIRGSDFKLPSDAGYLNCVLLQQTAYTDTKLYAKIGCLERDTYTSTKLAVHVYTDKQCSEPYDDGQSGETRASRGYNINGYRFSPKVSFRPPFYSCLSCKPSEIASSFSRKKTFWYDDDAAASGQQIQKFFDDWLDDYFLNDDKYFEVQKYVGNEKVYSKEDDDDFYTIDDDRRLEEVEQDKMQMQQKQQHGARNLIGKTLELQAAEGELESFEREFWTEQKEIRELGQYNKGYISDDDTKVQSWNICKKLYQYGVWCDEYCRSLDTFRIDQWSASDVLLLFVMLSFMFSMMLLILAKRVKAFEKAAIYGDDELDKAGIAPVMLASIFGVIFLVIIILAALRFVNETLVCAVVTCILLFTYMLKMTLFQTDEPLLGKKKRKDFYNGGLYT